MFSEKDFEKPARYDMKLSEPLKAEYPILGSFEESVFQQLKSHYFLIGKLVAHGGDIYASTFVINGALVRSLNSYRGALWALGTGNWCRNRVGLPFWKYLKSYLCSINSFYHMRRKNRFYYYYRRIRWGILKERSPIGAAIKITQRCNLSCKHCTWNNKITKDLPTTIWEKIIDDLYSQGVSILVIEGGEPTLHRGISRIVDYAKSKGMYCILITNGTQDISDFNPDVFWISIDGMKKSNDTIRGEGVFDKVIETLKKHSQKRFVSLTTLSKTNVDDIESLCEYFSGSTLLDGMMFHFEYPYGDLQDIALSKDERKKAAERMIKIKKKYPKLLNSVSYLNTVGKDKKCYPWLLVVVTADGKQQHGCMVKHIEREDCSKCDMGCYGELSRAYEFNKDTLEFWSKSIGFTKLL